MDKKINDRKKERGRERRREREREGDTLLSVCWAFNAVKAI